jgi:GntR family transcriptional regulator
MEIGRRLRDLPEIAALTESGALARFARISPADRMSERPIYSAAQNATAVAADADIAHRLGCTPGRPLLRIDRLLLRIDRLYRDRELTPLELAVNHFHPDRDSCRTRLDYATSPTAHGPR